MADDRAELLRIAQQKLSADEAFRAAVYMASRYIGMESNPDTGLVLFEQYLRSDPAAWGDWLRSVVDALHDSGAASPVHVLRVDGQDITTD